MPPEKKHIGETEAELAAWAREVVLEKLENGDACNPQYKGQLLETTDQQIEAMKEINPEG